MQQVVVHKVRNFLQFPLFRNCFFRTVRFHYTFDYCADHSLDYFADILRLQQLAALFIYNLTLLVHHIVILKNDFTHVKVVALNTFLCGFYGTGNQFALNRLIFFHAQTIHHRHNIFSAKTFHQFILEGEVELGGTRVTLTSCTSAQLVIDPSALVTFCTYDMQAASVMYAFT
ncbi:hypothetical protein D3C85_1101670 [compost metagenome]